METSTLTTSAAILKKAQVTGFLERICETLDLSQSQQEAARSRYEAVGSWLAESNDPLLREAKIYPQGSIKLGTIIKPINHEEYDVDLVCLVPGLTPQHPPTYIKNLIGERLKSNGRYNELIEEKPRCWRLNYANEFHLDITPSIRNPTCQQGGELVPDKKLKVWKPSNPKGYQGWFEVRAELRPKLALMEMKFAETRAQIEALPEPTSFSGLLRRCVQLYKRHRDIFFSNDDTGLAPISIILTTLAAESYAYCVTNFIYDTDLDVLLDVLKRMPSFIETKNIDDQKHYYVWNETTAGENFAEKWNQDSRLARAFHTWHRHALSDFTQLSSRTGLDQVSESLSLAFGESVASKAMASHTSAMNAARVKKLLAVAPGAGLVVTSAPGHVVGVRPNTFFGA